MTAAATATAREPVGTSRLHTSEPRWPTEQPALDETARHQLVVAGPSTAAQASASAWITAAQAAGTTCAVVPADPGALTAALHLATTGTRVAVAGDEVTIARAFAASLAGGLVATEVRAHLTDPEGPRPVRCVHCKSITDTTEPVDGVCDCSQCQRPLLIFPHYSRYLGAYLGFRVDAEELPA